MFSEVKPEKTDFRDQLEHKEGVELPQEETKPAEAEQVDFRDQLKTEV